MPKFAAYALIWSSEHNTYTVYEQGQLRFSSLSEDDEMWLAWLAKRSSFSFQGKHGHLNLLREARARGSEGYWYAYRRQGKRRIKQYAGRTPDLTIARLEELAHTPDFLMNETHSIEQRPRRQEQNVHAAQGPLLASRLRPPPLPAASIRRERLLALLEAGLEHRLTLLSAPAGSGKTTLLAQWLAAHRIPLVQSGLDALINLKVQNLAANGPTKTWSDVYISQ